MKISKLFFWKKPHFFTKSFFNELIYKYNELQEKKNTIDTVALGSSHGAAAFIAQDFSQTSFNLASASQDLFYSYQLLKYCKNNVPHLKTVFFFFSVFTPGFELQKTKEKERCAFFHTLFNIPFKFPLDDELIKILEACPSYYKKFKQKISTNGFIEQTQFFPKDYPIQERLNTHLRENTRENDQILYLKKITDFCKANNIILHVVIPPIRSDFSKLMPPKQILFQKCYQYIHQYDIIDFMLSPEFDDTDFGDFDHLNIQGAQKLTKLLKAKLQ